MPRAAIFVAAFLALTGLGAYLFLNQKAKESEVDEAITGLEDVTAGVDETNRAQRAAGKLSQGDFDAGTNLAESSLDQLTSLRDGLGDPEEADPTILRPISKSIRVSRSLISIGSALEATRANPDSEAVVFLRRQEKRLTASRRQVSRLTSRLEAARRLFAAAIETQIARLKALEEISTDSEEDAEGAIEDISKPIPPSLEAGLGQQIDGQLVRISDTLEWVEPRPGPRSCGETSSGTEVLINSGSVACQEAFFVLDNSSGPNSSTAPSGWDCSGFATDLDGNEIGGTAGYSCSRSDQATISFVAGDSLGEQQLTLFTTPSGNITCRMDVDGARCDILEKIYEPGYKPSSCLNDYGNALGVGTSGPGEVLCVGDTVADPSAPILDYGQSSAIGDFLCTVEEDGVSCDNTATGGGFSLSRMSIELR